MASQPANRAHVTAGSSIMRNRQQPIASTGTTLRDLESSNGTFINGLRITEAELTGPCELRFGMVRAEYRPAP